MDTGTESDFELFRSVGGVSIPTGEDEEIWHFGWFPVDPLLDAREDRDHWRLFSEAGRDLLNTGAGKTVLLYEAARQSWGRDLDLGPQQIGDCVGWGFAGAVDLLACVEVVAGEQEEYPWERRAAAEAIYALSRVEFGTLDGSNRDGSSSVWAAKAVVKGGTLSRTSVGDYSGQRAKAWGRTGLPDDLEPEAREHTVVSAALVTSYEQARDAIANGYPVAVGSNRGFKTRRDQDGFAAARGKWSHCMKFVAVKDDERPGLLCMNSWGASSPSGPKGQHAIPDGSFWVEAATCTQMLRQRGGFALSAFNGYPRRADLIQRCLTGGQSVRGHFSDQ